MIHDTWQPHALPIEVTLNSNTNKLQSSSNKTQQQRQRGPTIPSGTVAGTVSVSAQASDNRSVIALRVTNFGMHPATVSINVKPQDGRTSFRLEDAAVRCWQLSAPKLTDANTPGQPDKIVPKELEAVTLKPLEVPPFCFMSCEIASRPA
jgi:hypothetical protein